MKNKGALLAGAFGGVAPNLVRLCVNYSSPAPQHLISEPVSYFMAMVGFAIVGGLAVGFLQEERWKQALFLGVGLPSLFQIGTLQSLPSATLPPLTAPASAERQTSISLISSAFAQPPRDVSALVPGRRLNLTADKNVPFTVAFYRLDNSQAGLAPVTKPGLVEIPPDAAKFALQVGSTTSASYELPRTPGTVVNAQVTMREKNGSGFFQGLGLAKAPQYDVSVRVSR